MRHWFKTNTIPTQLLKEVRVAPRDPIMSTDIHEEPWFSIVEIVLEKIFVLSGLTVELHGYDLVMGITGRTFKFDVFEDIIFLFTPVAHNISIPEQDMTTSFLDIIIS